VTVEPGNKQLAGQLLAPDNRGSDMAAEDRRAVVAAAAMTVDGIDLAGAELLPSAGQ
jgi:hypothetical protein